MSGMYYYEEPNVLESCSDDKLINEILTREGLNFDKDMRYVIQEERRVSSSKPPYQLIGRGQRNATGSSMNAIQLMMEMSSSEQFLFSKVESHMDYKSCVGSCTIARFTQSEKQRVKLGYKKLRVKDILRRIKREHYMINPDFIVPNEDYRMLKSIYKGLK